MTARNARFWQHVGGGFVKLTLRPGESMAWSRGGRDEEGWYREWKRWTHVGDGIVNEAGADGADCDGRISTWREHILGGGYRVSSWGDEVERMEMRGVMVK